ncbi:slipin family protein [Candidatus Micrarchaeota archaeon]|nr:slipin family protein [Candidatus Micrarchaeota archaeon]
MADVNSVSIVVFLIIMGVFGMLSLAGGFPFLIIGFLLAIIAASSAKMASQWERAVVLRLGKFEGIRGPGLFFIVPVLDSVAYWLDLRTITTSFKAEQTLTKDTVPVNVDAVLFWKVVDPQKAALEVEDYQNAVNLASQTALRDVIGRTMLAEMLSSRESLDQQLQKVIDARTTPWGVKVTSVEIRDVIIPPDLQEAMSRQAQAERERQARIILGDSERQVAQKFKDAAEMYQGDPTALHLRAMNMLYESLKEKGALVIVPSSAVETMGLGGMLGTVAAAKQMGRTNRKQKKKRK